jgi:signal transduction histidine kinase
MKRRKKCMPCRKEFEMIFPIITFFMFICLNTIPARAQEKHMIQVRTFDQQLQPMKNVEVSINGMEFISLGSKGTAFVEISETDLPPKTILIKNEQFEPASWNYTRGVIEIVVRRKNYRIAHLIVKDPENNTIANTKVTFRGKKPVTATSNADGKLQIPLALDENLTSGEQFTVENHQVVSLHVSQGESVLTITRLLPAEETVIADAGKEETGKEYFRDFDLDQLDSIQSLTVFYAIFKNYSFRDLSPPARRRVDAKFNELYSRLQDSTTSKIANPFMGMISDSTYVADDIKNLLTQAELENQTLESQREDFDASIKLISEKLSEGVENLDAGTRSRLLSDLTMLERLLAENENKFFKNQNDYRQIINSLREKFFDVENLENKLSLSEAQRQEEQRVFRQRLLAISAVVVVFAILIVLLINFSIKLRKQKKKLEEANDEINRINENLEGIVYERTKLLEEANRELDTFLYRASHDLRSPLCSIIGLCNIALHLSPHELIERVEHTTESMDRLLRKLCMISEINHPTDYSEVALSEVANGVASRFTQLIRNNDIQFHIDCPDDIVFYSYPNIIDTVLSNLIENALFYSVLRDARHARVELTAQIKNDHVELCVSDNGIGIDVSMHNRLFDMFFKGHEKSKGNGLGLYIVHKSVQALGGSIRLESEPGRYTKFFVRFPIDSVAVPEGELVEAIQ